MDPSHCHSSTPYSNVEMLLILSTIDLSLSLALPLMLATVTDHESDRSIVDNIRGNPSERDRSTELVYITCIDQKPVHKYDVQCDNIAFTPFNGYYKHAGSIVSLI